MKPVKSLKFLLLIGFLVFVLVAVLSASIGLPEEAVFVLAFAIAGIVVYLLSPEPK